MSCQQKKYAFLFSTIFVLFIYSEVLFAQDGNRGLEVVAAPIAGDSAIGRQYAVFIAIDRYKEWPPLKNAVSDAERMRSVLQKRYYFDQIYTLYDDQATKEKVMKQFESLSNELCPEDSLFIFYAGHGVMDPLTRIGSWILQDAGANRYEQKGWLPNPQIRSLLNMIRSRHVFLVSDSCFSGDILNVERGSQPEITDEYFKKAYARRSRQVLTSGASEAVPDESVFTRALVRLFEENTKPYLDPLMLFNEIRLTHDLTTSPLLGTLKDTDSQDGGSFIFFLKQAQPVQAKVQCDPNGATMGTAPVDSDLNSLSSAENNYFTLGSTKEEVRRVMGTPTSINVYQALGKEEWHYSYSTVTFNNKGIVVEWNDLANVLKVFLGNPKAGSTFTLGSTKEDVIKAMGTPTSINVYQALGKEEWHYSYSTVTFNNKGIVVEWNDLANVLKLR